MGEDPEILGEAARILPLFESRIDQLELDLEGDLALQGFLGLSKSVRPGYEGIRVVCRVGSKASDQELQKLWAEAQNISPVLDIVRNPVPVSLEIQKIS